jgi:hypothetical protein
MISLDTKTRSTTSASKKSGVRFARRKRPSPGATLSPGTCVSFIQMSISPANIADEAVQAIEGV